MKTFKISFFFFILISLLASCSQKNIKGLQSYPLPPSTYKTPDFSDLRYWAAHPWKNDLSDSIPDDLNNNNIKDSSVDVFFIHPTSLTDYNDTSWNASIDDIELNNKTDRSSILYQASVFNQQCRVFAPRYRQAHLRTFFIDSLSASSYFDIAYSDVKNAFEYYLTHYNNGKPIIIASHSQGTLHAARLLKEYFDGKPLQQKLVCAYIIGLPVQQQYFSSLSPCKDSLSTGCFVGWRTFKSGYESEFVKKEKFKAVVINPLTWTANDELVPASFNKGAILRNYNKIIQHAVSAQVHNNVLWTSKPDVFGKIFLQNKNYHIGDINLFYMNIRENVNTRIRSYFNKL